MNTQIKDKSLAWYFHPNEIVRLLRIRTMEPIDSTMDFTPKYGDDIKIGAVIGTHGSTPYVDLGLHYLKNVNGIDKILIHDDHSDEVSQLKQLAKDYDVDLYRTPKNMFYKECVGAIGDQDCFYEGLKWAKQNDIDILVKFSRRLIPCYRWIDDFKKLVKESDGVTFSSYCSKDPFPIRTECIGMNVAAWTNQFTLSHLQFTIDNELCIFAEFWFDSMAKQIDGQNFSKKYKEWKESHYVPQLYSGYVHWYDLLGKCRYNSNDRHSNVLWHMYSSAEDYHKKLQEVFHNKYDLNALKLKPGM